MPAETHETTIDGVRYLTPHVLEIALRQPDPPLHFEPGQWVSLHLPVGEKPPLIRAYSLARPEESGSLTLCLDRVPEGLGSDYLFERQVGDPLILAGPYGNFVLPESLETDLLFVARFTGIVPFRCMLLALKDRPRDARVRLVYGASDPQDLVYHEEFQEQAASDPRFEYYPTILEPDPGWQGDVGTELELLARHAASWIPSVPMVCGVREFTRPVRGFFMEELGFERRAVRMENYN
jgi:ferredoxin-NADP reductase